MHIHVTLKWRRAQSSKTVQMLDIHTTNRGFVKKNVGGFRYKPRGDWFSFAKAENFACFAPVNKLASISLRHVCCTYVLRHLLERLPHTTVRWSEREVFITFEIWIFFLQKRMDSLQEAFIHPPEPCKARFIMDACTLFDVFWTVEQKHPPYLPTLPFFLGFSCILPFYPAAIPFKYCPVFLPYF